MYASIKPQAVLKILSEADGGFSVRCRPETADTVNRWWISEPYFLVCFNTDPHSI